MSTHVSRFPRSPLGRERHFHPTAVEGEAGWSRPQLGQPRVQAQLSARCQLWVGMSFLGSCHLPLLTSVSPQGGLILGAPLASLPPHGASSQAPPTLSPLLLHPVFLSLIPPLLPFPWQPHPPLCRSVLRSHLSFLFHLSPHRSVWSRSPSVLCFWSLAPFYSPFISFRVLLSSQGDIYLSLA